MSELVLDVIWIVALRVDWNTDARKSVWSAVGEIEFYGSGTVSTNGPEFDKGSLKYPVPAKDLLHILNPNRANLITIYDI